MPLNVLVTGGAGYLGSVLCQRLLEAGHRVSVLDKLLYGPANLFHLSANESFEFVQGDSRDEDTIKRLLKDADVIIPLAAVVGAPACDRDPWMATSTNYEAIAMLNHLRSPRQLVIYPNTNSGYGAKSGAVFCTEETPLEPISLYGVDKVNAERELLASPNAIALRLATVFGASPRMRIDLLVNHFVYAAVTDGFVVIFEKDFKRNYIHIRDVADCFAHAIENASKMTGRAFNAGLDDANLSKAELAEKIRQYVPRFYIHYGEVGSDPDQRNYVVSNQRLREAGFEARRSLDFGIVELLKTYRMFGRGQFKNV
jgi:nucleoside-diphosphate-sugar epimerase